MCLAASELPPFSRMKATSWRSHRAAICWRPTPETRSDSGGPAPGISSANSPFPVTSAFLKFSPDGTRLASLSHPDEVTVWEVDQWAVVRRIRGVRLAGAHIGALDFSPDSKALVIGDADHHLQVVDLASGNTDVNIPEAHSEGITAVAWSPNGSVIASGSGFSGGPIRLWDAASGKPLGALEGHTSWICELIFSADGLRLYSASADQTIRIWDVGQRRCLATLRGSSDEVYGLALSPDGTTLASACKDGVVAFWSALPRPEEELPRLIALGQTSPGQPSLRTAGYWRCRARGPSACSIWQRLKKSSSSPRWAPTFRRSPIHRTGLCWSAEVRVEESACGPVPSAACCGSWAAPRTRFTWVGFRADGRRLLSFDAKGKAIWWDTAHVASRPNLCGGTLLVTGGLSRRMVASWWSAPKQVLCTG